MSSSHNASSRGTISRCSSDSEEVDGLSRSSGSLRRSGRFIRAIRSSFGKGQTIANAREKELNSLVSQLERGMARLQSENDRLDAEKTKLAGQVQQLQHELNTVQAMFRQAQCEMESCKADRDRILDMYKNKDTEVRRLLRGKARLEAKLAKRARIYCSATGVDGATSGQFLPHYGSSSEVSSIPGSPSLSITSVSTHQLFFGSNSAADLELSAGNVNSSSSVPRLHQSVSSGPEQFLNPEFHAMRVGSAGHGGQHSRQSSGVAEQPDNAKWDQNHNVLAHENLPNLTDVHDVLSLGMDCMLPVVIYVVAFCSVKMDAPARKFCSRLRDYSDRYAEMTGCRLEVNCFSVTGLAGYHLRDFIPKSTKYRLFVTVAFIDDVLKFVQFEKMCACGGKKLSTILENVAKICFICPTNIQDLTQVNMSSSDLVCFNVLKTSSNDSTDLTNLFDQVLGQIWLSMEEMKYISPSMIPLKCSNSQRIECYDNIESQGVYESLFIGSIISLDPCQLSFPFEILSAWFDRHEVAADSTVNSPRSQSPAFALSSSRSPSPRPLYDAGSYSNSKTLSLVDLCYGSSVRMINELFFSQSLGSTKRHLSVEGGSSLDCTLFLSALIQHFQLKQNHGYLILNYFWQYECKAIVETGDRLKLKSSHYASCMLRHFCCILMRHIEKMLDVHLQIPARLLDFNELCSLLADLINRVSLLFCGGIIVILDRISPSIFSDSQLSFLLSRLPTDCCVIGSFVKLPANSSSYFSTSRQCFDSFTIRKVDQQPASQLLSSVGQEKHFFTHGFDLPGKFSYNPDYLFLSVFLLDQEMINLERCPHEHGCVECLYDTALNWIQNEKGFWSMDNLTKLARCLLVAANYGDGASFEDLHRTLCVESDAELWQSLRRLADVGLIWDFGSVFQFSCSEAAMSMMKLVKLTMNEVIDTRKIGVMEYFRNSTTTLRDGNNVSDDSNSVNGCPQRSYWQNFSRLLAVEIASNERLLLVDRLLGLDIVFQACRKGVVLNWLELCMSKLNQSAQALVDGCLSRWSIDDCLEDDLPIGKVCQIVICHVALGLVAQIADPNGSINTPLICLERAEEICRMNLESDSLLAADLQQLMSQLFLQFDRFSGAETGLRSALATYRKVLKSGDGRTVACTELLHSLYIVTGKGNLSSHLEKRLSESNLSQGRGTDPSIASGAKLTSCHSSNVDVSATNSVIIPVPMEKILKKALDAVATCHYLGAGMTLDSILECTRTLIGFGRILVCLNKLPDAENCLSRACSFSQRLPVDQHQQECFQVYYLLFICYVKSCKWTKAEACARYLMSTNGLLRKNKISSSAMSLALIGQLSYVMAHLHKYDQAAVLLRSELDRVYSDPCFGSPSSSPGGQESPNGGELSGPLSYCLSLFGTVVAENQSSDDLGCVIRYFQEAFSVDSLGARDLAKLMKVYVKLMMEHENSADLGHVMNQSIHLMCSHGYFRLPFSSDI